MSNITNPIFVVGCCRSGTTLLQSILAASPGVHSFPETNVLYTAIEDIHYRQYGRFMGRSRIPYYLYVKIKNRLGYTKGFNKGSVTAFLDAIEKPQLFDDIPWESNSLRNYFENFSDILYEASEGKRWLEKTPQNLFCIEEIERYISKPLFIHIVRNSEDNLASLMDAAKKYASFSWRFGGDKGLDRAIFYYNSALYHSKKYANKENHLVVRYEDIASKSEQVINRLSSFSGIPLNPDKLEYNIDGLTMEQEVWKKDQPKEISIAKSKFLSVFDEQERIYIKENIANVDGLIPRMTG